MSTQTAPAVAKSDRLPVDPAEVFVVIPAYNEAARIGPVLDGLLSLYAGLNVVVIDDGSTDQTAQLAAQRGAIVLRHVINRGQGAALQTGITYSLLRGANYIVTFDADGQHNPADLPALLEPLAAGKCDVALGSRFLGRAPDLPALRRLLLYAGTVFTRLTSGLKLTDCHNGLRAISRQAAHNIQLRQDRMAHASEFYDHIRRAGLRYLEVPVTIKYSAETLSKGQKGLNALSVAFHYLFGKVRG